MYYVSNVLQNKAAKVILDRPLYSSASDALQTLGWKSLSERRRFHRSCMVFKCFNALIDLILTLTKYVCLIFITITLDREVILSFQYIERTGVKVDQISSLLINSINYLGL
jgi:hypothetical protein